MSQLILGSSIKMELASKVDYISLIFGIENVYLPLVIFQTCFRSR